MIHSIKACSLPSVTRFRTEIAQRIVNTPQNSDEKLKVKSLAYRRTRRRPHRRKTAANRMIFCFDALESINPRSSFLNAPACFLIIYYYREEKRLCPPQK